ncbi:Crp/Fnr family transcriptional regulator [Maribacter sp.]|uniref:Crp/Fnr family transcriptional regulator n=1 Tax=Maribacter sp. TaxID=1897614 RepID=UPI0025C42F8B|nr:Crp/Fnr family transcriptional regulator [Maribacter sp.]
MEEVIVSEIFKNITLSSVEISKISSGFTKLEIKKGVIIMKANEFVLHQYFVSKGCLRAFFVNQQGKEHTVQFAVKDWWISDYTAFFSSSKGILQIECLQDATLYKLSRENMERFYVEIPKLESFFRKKMEKAFAGFQKRILGNLALSAKERYVTFTHTYPSIEQNVKNYHIASYLGITTESLSRIRKEIATS